MHASSYVMAAAAAGLKLHKSIVSETSETHISGSHRCDPCDDYVGGRRVNYLTT